MANPNSGITPVGKRVLVKPKALEDKTAGGILLSPQQNRPRNRGTVVDVGSEVEAVTFGDDILFLAVLTIVEGKDGEEYFLLDEKDVAAILN